MADGEPCPRCGELAVAFDSSASCDVCQSCGYVPDNQGFVSYREAAAETGTEERQATGQTGAAAAYAAAAGAHASTAAGLPYDPRAAAVRWAADPGGSARGRRQARELDALAALAGALRLPGSVSQLAAGFLARLHQGGPPPDDPALPAQPADRRPSADGADDEAAAGAGAAHLADAAASTAPPPPRRVVTGGAESAARLGALLYLAARSERQPLSMAEVAAACQSDMFRLAEIARQQAAYLRLALPAVDVERFVHRMARDLLAAGALPPYDSGGGNDGGGGGPSGGAAGAGGAGGGSVSESELWRHPLMGRTAQLAALVVRRGWHEGKTPRTVAGAVLSICLDMLAADQGGGALPTAALARHSMCHPGQLARLKHEIQSELLALAAPLPFAPLMSHDNVAAYLDVIEAAAEVLEAQRG